MPAGLGKFSEMLGDDFDTVIDAFRQGMTPQMENMLMGTMDSMLFDSRTFANGIEKHVTLLQSRGISSEVINQTLRNDMQTGGRIFGQLKNDVKAATHGAVNQAGGLGQQSEYDENSNFMWVTVAGHKVCLDCATRGGHVLKYKEWEGEGLPGIGWSVCKSFCYCILDPIGKSGKQIDAPDAEAARKSKFADTETKAREKLKLSDAQKSKYDKGKRLGSDGAKTGLKNKNLTRSEALKQLSEHRAKLAAAGPDTKTLNFIKTGESFKLDRFGKKILGSDGKYKMTDIGYYPRDRAILHNRIARSIVQQGKIADDAADLLMTGGYPGSGKSTMLDSAFPGWQKKYVHLDSDHIKGLLAAFDDTTISWNAAQYHEEADDIIRLIFQKSFNENRHLLFDGTMKNSQKMIDLISDFHSAGNYNPYIAFSDLPMEKAIERAILRATGPSGATGRFVEPYYITTHLGENIKTFDALKDKFEDFIKYTKYDNDVPFNTDPILLETNI